MKFVKIFRIFFILILAQNNFLLSLDVAHFYKARTFCEEPRFCTENLTSLDIIFSGGSTCTSRNHEGEKVPLLAIFGPENLKNNLDLPLFNYMGRVSVFETQIHGFLNFCNGFFVHAHLPIRSLEIYDLKRCAPDNFCIKKNKEKKVCACNGTCFKQKNKKEEKWCCGRDPLTPIQIKDLNDFLAQHKLNAGPVKESGVGDLSLLLGWSTTTYDLCQADFIDASLQLGVLFPTGKKKDINKVFSLPLGYDGFWGLPVIMDLATGIWNWLNFGVHFGNILFLDRTKKMRLKSFKDETGFIRPDLPQKVKIDPGILWDMSIYAKADHFAMGLSVLLGYSHTHKSSVSVNSTNKSSSNFNFVLANSDPILRGWSMDVLHVILEYDWSCEDNYFGPRLAFEYDYVLGGKNIFNNSATSGYFGINFEYCF